MASLGPSPSLQSRLNAKEFCRHGIPSVPGWRQLSKEWPCCRQRPEFGPAEDRNKCTNEIFCLWLREVVNLTNSGTGMQPRDSGWYLGTADLDQKNVTSLSLQPELSTSLETDPSRPFL